MPVAAEATTFAVSVGDFIVVLKGSKTAVLSSSTTPSIGINPTGNCGMGTPGSGDVLCGIIAACICHRAAHQSVGENFLSSIWKATCDAVWIHGRCGDISRDRLGGEDGIVASDIMDSIPKVMGEIRNSENMEDYRKYYPKIII